MKNIFLFLFLLSISYLIPLHFAPWLTFLSEICVFLGVFFLFFISYKKDIVVPRAFVPLLIIPFIPFVQFFFGYVFYLSNVLICFSYLMTFVLILILIRDVCVNYKDKEKIFITFSIFISIVGGINFIISIIQWLNFSHNGVFIAQIIGNRIYSNISQPNNLATLQILSIVSLLYIYLKKKINLILLYLITTFILFSVVLTQSRTGFLSLIMIFLFSLFYFSFFKKNKNIIAYFLYCSCVYLFMNNSISFFSNYLRHNGSIDVVNTGSIVSRGLDSSGRIDIWIQMYHAILERPLLGYGWHQVSLAQTEKILEYPIKIWVNSSHNIIIDLFIWVGVPLGLIIILYFIYLIIKAFMCEKDIEIIFAFLMIIVILTHSMLEYPLFYAYFLFPFAVLMGVFLSNIDFRKKIVFPFQCIILYSFLLLLGIFFVWSDYLAYVEENKKAINYYIFNNGESYVNEGAIKFLDELNFRLYWIGLNPKSKLTMEEMKEIKKMVSLYPTHFDLYKYAKILANNGYYEEANDQIKMIKLMYGVDYSLDKLFLD